MNRLMMLINKRCQPMAEAEKGGGGGNPPPANDPPKNDPPPANDPPANDPPKNDPPKNDPPVNLMGDDDGDEQHEEPKPPTEDEQKAYRESIKTIDLGDGVKWDDPSLEAMTPELMRLTGNDPKKAEGIVKAYTDFQRKQVAAQQERSEQFLSGLVDQCRERFGDDLQKICALAKAGGRKIFGDELWNVMRQERAFANNPDIIERLAAFGRSAQDDKGVVKKEVKPAVAGSGDWRTNMYGKK